MDDMVITWSLTQQHWFDYLQYNARYSSKEIYEALMAEGNDAIENYHPKKYSFRLRFFTYDPTCPTCDSFADEVAIVIENSG
jgi:hypothetical protein